MEAFTLANCHTRHLEGNLETRVTQVLENTSRIILGRSGPQPLDGSLTVRRDDILHLVGIVEEDPTPVQVQRRGISLNILRVSLDVRERNCLILSPVDGEGNEEHDAVTSGDVVVQSHAVATHGDALVDDGLGDGLEHAEGVEARVSTDGLLEIRVEGVEFFDGVVHDPRIVVECESEPGVTEAGRLAGTEFVCDNGDQVDLGSVLGNVAGGIVGVKGRGCNFGQGVLDSGVEDHTAELGEVSPVDNRRAVLILVDVLRELNEGVDDFGSGLQVVDEVASPDYGLGWVGEVNGVHVEAGHKTEVGTGSLETLPQIRVGSGIGIDDGSISKDHLKVGNLVTGKTVRRRVEGVAAAEDEASSSDGTSTATCDDNTIRGESVVDSLPVTAGSDGGDLRFRVVGGAVEEAKVDGDTIVDTVGSSKGAVAAAANAECAVGRSEGGDNG